jgi:hypothetical protein
MCTGTCQASRIPGIRLPTGGLSPAWRCRKAARVGMHATFQIVHAEPQRTCHHVTLILGLNEGGVCGACCRALAPVRARQPVANADMHIVVDVVSRSEIRDAWRAASRRPRSRRVCTTALFFKSSGEAQTREGCFFAAGNIVLPAPVTRPHCRHRRVPASQANSRRVSSPSPRLSLVKYRRSTGRADCHVRAGGCFEGAKPSVLSASRRFYLHSHSSTPRHVHTHTSTHLAFS